MKISFDVQTQQYTITGSKQEITDWVSCSIPNESQEWIPWIWTKEKPFPLTTDIKVDVKFVDGSISKNCSVGIWHSHDVTKSNWYNLDSTSDCDIMFYRISKST